MRCPFAFFRQPNCFLATGAKLIQLDQNVITEYVRGAKRRLFATPARLPGYVDLVRSLRKDAIAIIAHHGVTADALTVPNGCQLDVVEFDKQLRLLAELYTVLPLKEIISRLAGGKQLPPNTACLTFDDGFRNVATTAYPLLEKYQMPATVFLVTGFVGTRQPAWPDWVYYAVAETEVPEVSFEGVTIRLSSADGRQKAYRQISTALKPKRRADRERLLDDLRAQLGDLLVPDDHPVASLNWDEVHELASTGLVDFGSHTHTHPILSRCSDEEQWHELETSRDVLLGQGLSADLFAYPNGTFADFTPSTQRMLRELGYRCAVSMRPGLNKRAEDLYALRRIGVGADTTIRDFELRTAGL